MRIPTVQQVLQGATATIRETLHTHTASTLVFEVDGRQITLDLMPDGATSWILRIRHEEDVLFDSGGYGVVGVDEESLAKIVVASFRLLDRRVGPN